METLTRIGTVSHKDNSLRQICFILHKRRRYYIVHFKQLQYLDGMDVEMSQDEIDQLNYVALVLHTWNLIEPVKPIPIYSGTSQPNIKIIRFDEKANWILRPLYNIGKGNYNGQVQSR